MIFRLAGIGDLEILSEMRWQNEQEAAGSFEITRNEFVNQCTAFLKEGLEKGSWVYWLAEDNDLIISNVFIHKIQKVPRPQKLVSEIGYVTNVYTRAEYRNEGIGTALLKEVKGWALESNIELLIVWPSKKSVSFYKRQGFVNENEMMELRQSTSDQCPGRHTLFN